MGNRTLCLLKPDCIESGLIGAVIQHLENDGFKIYSAKMVYMTREVAEEFYSVHKGESFFVDLVNFMVSGRSFAMVLERENAVEKLREVIGATDPKEAKEGTIRFKYAENKQNNIIHASDKEENAEREIRLFFSNKELIENGM